MKRYAILPAGVLACLLFLPATLLSAQAAEVGQIDDAANAAFYGVDYISPRDIQTRKDLKVPAEAEELRQTVNDYTQSLGR